MVLSSFYRFFLAKKRGIYWLLLFTLCQSACKQKSFEPSNNELFVRNVLDKSDEKLNGGTPEEAILFLDSMYQKIRLPGNLDLWHKYHFKANYYLNYTISTEKARRYVDSMELMLENKSLLYKKEYATTVFARGDVLLAEKDYSAAFKCYYDGKNFARENLDSCDYADFSSKLALVLYAQEKYQEAIPYFKQSILESQHCKSGSGFFSLFILPQSTLNNIGLCFEQSSMPDSAIYYYRQALDFIDRKEAQFSNRKQFIEMARGVIYGNLGGTYVVKKNYPEARKYLLESIRINDRPGYAVDDAITAKQKLVDLYINSAQTAAAGALLQQLEQGLLSYEKRNRAKDFNKLKFYKLKWKYYDLTGQKAQSYIFAQKYYHLNDSITQNNSGLKNADIDEGFRMTEQGYKVTLLSKSTELQRAYLTAIIIFSLLILIILGMAWYSLKRSRSYIGKLKSLNQQITDHNAEMQSALAALEHSQAENTKLLQVVAHDLRNPVGGMTMGVSLLLTDKKRSEKDLTLMEMIKRSGNDALQLINDLLNTHTNKEELKKEPVDLFDLLNYCVELLSFKAELKQQRIQLIAEHAVLSISREKMWRVISNLIGNAIKFSFENSLITVRLEKYEDKVRIGVEDQGIGIPSEMKDNIFKMFSEAKRSGTASEQAFGMGLFISKQIVEAHGGELWFESKVDEPGTIFYIDLPIS